MEPVARARLSIISELRTVYLSLYKFERTISVLLSSFINSIKFQLRKF
jgi:hypothetical protein